MHTFLLRTEERKKKEQIFHQRNSLTAQHLEEVIITLSLTQICSS
jgi:hypothetical protein